MNSLQSMSIVSTYDDGGVRLGGGFRAVAGGDMTDTQKARKYMNLLRVPGYERWNNSGNFGGTGQGRPRLHPRQEKECLVLSLDPTIKTQVIFPS